MKGLRIEHRGLIPEGNPCLTSGKAKGDFRLQALPYVATDRKYSVRVDSDKVHLSPIENSKEAQVPIKSFFAAIGSQTDCQGFRAADKKLAPMSANTPLVNQVSEDQGHLSRFICDLPLLGADGEARPTFTIPQNFPANYHERTCLQIPSLPHQPLTACAFQIPSHIQICPLVKKRIFPSPKRFSRFFGQLPLCQFKQQLDGFFRFLVQIARSFLKLQRNPVNGQGGFHPSGKRLLAPSQGSLAASSAV